MVKSADREPVFARWSIAVPSCDDSKEDGSMSTVQAAATVMIVDDDPALGAMISEYLTGQGMIAVPVATGREMLKILETKALDLVLLDLQLKNEDGLDVLRELRQRSDVPVIIATGHRKDEIDRVVGLASGPCCDGMRATIRIARPAA
jgi:CheY-like chemotaxis protein